MDYSDEIERLLASAGAIETTGRKHRKWKLPDGRVFVMARSPSDWRQTRKALADLRHLLGLVRPVARTGERRPKRLQSRQKAAKFLSSFYITGGESFEDKLKRALGGD